VQRFYQEKDRRLALGSVLLQRALASWVLRLPFAEVAIQRTERNKPFVDCRATALPAWNFNISHHGDIVVAACEPRHSVGVDLVNLEDRPFDEMTSMQYVEHFRRHLTPHEWEILIQAPNDESR
jgi:4'-phosphopantetheinyl transferase